MSGVLILTAKIGFVNIEFPCEPPFKEGKGPIEGGGGGKSLLDLINNMNNSNFSKLIFSVGESKNIEIEKPNPNLTLIRYPYLKNKVLDFLPVNNSIISPSFYLEPKYEHLNVIHCQLGYPGADICSLIIKNKQKIPLVLSIRQVPKVNWGRLSEKIIMRSYIDTVFKHILKKSDRIVVQSEIIKEEAIFRGYRDKIEVVPNGINFEVYSRYNNAKKSKLVDSLNDSLDLKLDEKENIILFVGFFVERKGIETLIKSFKLFSKNNPTSKLILVGKGDLRTKVINFSKSNKLEDKILLVDYIKDEDLLAKVYATADLFVLPSLAEGFPRVVLESLAAGTPVLVSDIPENMGAIQDGKYGLVASVSNPKSFCKKIDMYFNMDEKEKRKLIVRGVQYAKTHTWEDVGKKMEEIYYSIL